MRASRARAGWTERSRSEEHTSELQSQSNLVCRLLLEKKKNNASIDLRAPNQITEPEAVHVRAFMLEDSHVQPAPQCRGQSHRRSCGGLCAILHRRAPY